MASWLGVLEAVGPLTATLQVGENNPKVQPVILEFHGISQGPLAIKASSMS